MLLRESDALAALGYPLLLSASNKRFLGELLGLRDRRPARRVAGRGRRTASPHGCRIVRVHDVRRDPAGSATCSPPCSRPASPWDRTGVSPAASGPVAVVLVKGEDPSLVSDAVRDAVDAALAGEDRSFALEELGGEDSPSAPSSTPP